MPPLSVNFSALPIRFVAICRKASASPSTSRRASGAIATRSASRFSSISGAIRRTVSSSTAAGSNGACVERHRAGLDPRDVEQPVHQLELAARRGEQDVEHVPRLRLQLAHLQELGDADDAVQRRAKLVADVAQELGLGPVRGPGLRQRALEPARRADELARDQEHDGADRDHQPDERPQRRPQHGPAGGRRRPAHPGERRGRRRRRARSTSSPGAGSAPTVRLSIRNRRPMSPSSSVVTRKPMTSRGRSASATPAGTPSCGTTRAIASNQSAPPERT